MPTKTRKKKKTPTQGVGRPRHVIDWDRANLILNTRTAFDLTQRELSEMTGISISRISRIEQEGAGASDETWQKLADALGLEFIPSQLKARGRRK